MRMMQRVVLVLVLIVGFMIGITEGYQRRKIRLQEQWGIVQTERLLQKICNTGKCSYEECYLFHTALHQCGIDAKIRIEEYQREQDMEGRVYYHLISWEELKLYLLQEACYKFAEESVVCVQVQTENGWKIERWREIKDDF